MITKQVTFFLIFTFMFWACANENSTIQNSNKVKKEPIQTENYSVPKLDVSQANQIAKLPLKCVQNPLPYKAGHVLSSEKDLAMPQEHHPVFYGCFDWHSAVHGHWSLIYLLKTFPDLEQSKKVRSIMNQHFTQENFSQEIAYFSMNKYTKNFERTYGWAWLLKLAEELYTWDDTDAQKWYKEMEPLIHLICDKYIEYLPNLVYPIRVGEHSNTAFGLSFAYDFALTTNKVNLREAIEDQAKAFYLQDESCPIHWEPSGYDFLSPCLQEINIVQKVTGEAEFITWLKKFQPSIFDGTFNLEPAIIKDRSDGKLVHLDGLNFSRAWCLYPLVNVLPQDGRVSNLADKHLAFSLTKMADGDYSGEHWLASFALFAYKMRIENGK